MTDAEYAQIGRWYVHALAPRIEPDSPIQHQPGSAVLGTRLWIIESPHDSGQILVARADLKSAFEHLGDGSQMDWSAVERIEAQMNEASA